MDYLNVGLMTEDEVEVNSNISFYEELSLDATGKDTGKKAAATALSLAPALVAAAPIVAMATV